MQDKNEYELVIMQSKDNRKDTRIVVFLVLNVNVIEKAFSMYNVRNVKALQEIKC